jgi:hypothetical protein
VADEYHMLKTSHIREYGSEEFSAIAYFSLPWSSIFQVTGCIMSSCKEREETELDAFDQYDGAANASPAHFV